MRKIKNYRLAGLAFVIMSIANLIIAIQYIPGISDNKNEFALNLLIGILAGAAAISFFVADKRQTERSRH